MRAEVIVIGVSEWRCEENSMSAGAHDANAFSMSDVHAVYSASAAVYSASDGRLP